VHVRVYIYIYLYIYIDSKIYVHTDFIILFSYKLIELRNFKPINYRKIKKQETKNSTDVKANHYYTQIYVPKM